MRTRHSTIAYLFVAFLCVLVLLSLYRNPPQFFPGDFPSWSSDFLSLYSCLQANQHSTCQDISVFPLAYTLNSWLSAVLSSLLTGLSPPQVLLIINLILFGLVAYLILYPTTRISRRTYSCRALLLLTVIVLTPIIPFYLNTGFLELQSAAWIFLVFLFAPYSRCHRQRSWLNQFLFVFFFVIASMYKDTLAIMLFVSISLGRFFFELSATHHSIRSNAFYLFIRAIFQPLLLIALISSVMASFAFNYIRYESILPIGYLLQSSMYQTSSQFKLISFLASILSPQGGLVAFWGLPLFALVIYCRHIRINQRLVSAFFLFLLNLFALPFWWAPFGWDSWGNRLIIPAFLSFFYIACSSLNYSSASAALVPVNLSKPPLLFLSCLSLVLALLYFLSSHLPWGRVQFLRHSLYHSPACRTFAVQLSESKKYDQKIYETCAASRYWSMPLLRI